jgi:glycosyltransferase involved in cell wall biosynthesis
MDAFDRTGDLAPARNDTPARVAVLGAGIDNRPGGQLMRWEALRKALSTYAPTVRYRLTCNRWQECRSSCQLTGAPLREPTSQRDFGSLRYTHAFCSDYADALLRELIRTGISTVVCSGLETYRYLTIMAESRRFRLVFDMHNVEYDLSLSLHRATTADPLTPFAWLFTEAYVEHARAAEQDAISVADEVWVCSGEDRRLVLATYPGVPPAKVRVVPNVLDLHAYPKWPDDRPAPRRVCFTGRFDYPPNAIAGWLLIHRVAPLLDGSGAGLPVVVAGRLAREALGSETPPPNVRLVSDPQRVPDEIISGSIMAVPLTVGSGSRFKILEAFACGAPVVSTPKGTEGLDAIAGTHYLSASEPAEFATSIKELVNDRSTRDRLTHAARQLVDERYSVPALARGLRGTVSG